MCYEFVFLLIDLKIQDINTTGEFKGDLGIEYLKICEFVKESKNF